MYITITSTHEGDIYLRAERTGNSGTQFILHALFAETFGTCVHHHSEET